MMHFSRRELLKLTGLSVAGAMLAACQPKATPEAQEEAATPTTAQPAEEAPAQEAQVAPKEVTQLIFWDQFGQEATAVDTIVNLFNEAHKDEVFVKRESQPNMRDILKTALSSGSGPDIMYYDTGPGFAGVLARAGLLLPIDDAYEEYGWNDKVIAWAKDRTAFDGKTYGIGHEIEFLGVFYNMRLYEEEGLAEPETHEDYLTICETLKGKGYIPIAFGDQPKWPAYHEFSIFANNIAGPSKVAAAISGEQPWNDPDFVQAIQMFFVDMREAGYLTPDPNAITYDDANLLFYNGQAGMTMTGTWMVADYTNPDTMADPVGFYFYPSIQGKPIAPPAGLGSGYFISQVTKDATASCQFLDFIVVSKEAAKIWIEQLAKIPPIKINPADYQISDLMRFCLESLQELGDTAGYNIDVLTPDTFNTMMGDGFQEVLAGTKSPQEQADDLEEVMRKAVEEGKVMDITP